MPRAKEALTAPKRGAIFAGSGLDEDKWKLKSL